MDKARVSRLGVVATKRSQPAKLRLCGPWRVGDCLEFVQRFRGRLICLVSVESDSVLLSVGRRCKVQRPMSRRIRPSCIPFLEHAAHVVVQVSEAEVRSGRTSGDEEYVCTQAAVGRRSTPVTHGNFQPDAVRRNSATAYLPRLFHARRSERRLCLARDCPSMRDVSRTSTRRGMGV